jgi:tetratricopeptide (TPR) repeat protein
VLLAQILAQQERLPDAWAMIEDARRDLEQRHVSQIESYHFARGDILARMNRYDEAIAEFRQEIAEFPTNRQTYANLYLVYRVRGQNREADATLADMVRAIPGRETREFAVKTAKALGELR